MVFYFHVFCVMVCVSLVCYRFLCNFALWYLVYDFIIIN